MARTILIADDNPIIRKMLCQMLRREEDYDVCAEAANGQEAIDLAIKQRPELIVLDLSMPVLNGLDASRQLKKLLPGIPIILFTQYADLEHSLFRDGVAVDRIVPKDEAYRLMNLIRELIPV
jgi:CheY-like chemotaxis protein